MPKKTPWGDADYETPIIPRAVTLVTTPSHGGLMVSKVWAEKNLSDACRDEALVSAGYYCYEEDSAWYLVVNESPPVFEAFRLRGEKISERTIESFRKEIDTVLGNYYKDYLAKVAGSFNGVTFRTIRAKDKLVLKGPFGNVTYEFLYPYDKKPREWVVSKNGKSLVRISWELVQSYIRSEYGSYFRDGAKINTKEYV